MKPFPTRKITGIDVLVTLDCGHTQHWLICQRDIGDELSCPECAGISVCNPELEQLAKEIPVTTPEQVVEKRVKRKKSHR